MKAGTVYKGPGMGIAAERASLPNAKEDHAAGIS
jgi:hypothetical protein